VARALDVVGERWTLLIVRDLAIGPRRYTDLREGLPGIPTDLLTARLRTLEAAGFVTRRKLSPPAPAVVYELTDAGRRRLAPVILALADVGVELLGPPTARDRMSAERVALLVLHHAFRAAEAAGLDETYELILDGEPFTIRVGGGEADATRGHASVRAAMTLATDTRCLLELLRGEARATEVLAQRRARLEGDRRALDRFIAAFAYRFGESDGGDRRAAAAPASIV
jgi:DNA-binding HxlR family transcriptional regulator/putative sterol carrier protein